MKKLLWIVVLGLFFSNIAEAKLLELESCYQYNQEGGSKTYKDVYKEWDNETWEYYWQKKKGIERSVISISPENGTVTWLNIWTDKSLEESEKTRKKKVEEAKKLGIELPNPVSNKYKQIEGQIINYAGGIIFARLPNTIAFNGDAVQQEIIINLNDKSLVLKHINQKNISDRSTNINFYYTCKSSETNIAGDQEIVPSGTAFFISKNGYLLTNNHVVDVKGCKTQRINYFNKEYKAKIISTDKALDLALLKVKAKPKSYISFSNKEPKKRQQIIIAGYPLGQGLSDDLKINDGRISSLKGFENNSNEITVDVAINPGNSGGPIINQKGQLVAIAVAGMSKDVTEGINFGIKASAAKNFLKSNKISPSAGYLNFSMDDDKIVELLEESTVYTYCN